MLSSVSDGSGGAASIGSGAARHTDKAPKRLRIRGGSGLGDAIYLQSVVRHFVERGYRPEVCCDWPDVFRPLAGQVDVVPFRKKDIDRLAHYSMRRGVAGTSQFEDGCIQAGISEPVEFKLDWTVRNRDLQQEVLFSGRPVVVVQMPRPPFGRADGFGMEFLPDCRRIQDAITHIGRRAYFVQVGAGQSLLKFSGIDLDMTNSTTVSDLLDISAAARGFLGYCSYIVPLAEAQSKPAMLVWSRKGLNSPHQVVRHMTPTKILHRKSSLWVMDDAPDNEMMACADAFLEQIASR